MILNHIWGLYAHPLKEWKTIDERHESMPYALSHILLIALIPCAIAYYASVHIGWNIGARDTTFLTAESATMMAVAMYLGIIVGCFALGYLIHWMAKTFGAKPTFTQSFELAAYTATPAIMSGVGALYPELWFITMVFLAGIAYSVYLLYTGVPILMHIPEERGFIYASSVVTAGLIMLVVLMVTSAIIWTNGFMPQYVG
ncbi:Yip1 family protein [Pseudidiomarina taiwanensis]|uniref:Yip1 domain-containing protein n=1 Tax=Pseudidiomarina taiwanensis TaxID=337250 RepID=A0A432ZJZ8_9GAMM|nr:Yip1 family protein [Pseudidiomarina taiwanensis]RUO78291.1 hypothetical protein CWI83_04460 [Pseudidiomarina taiwanensis]